MARKNSKSETIRKMLTETPDKPAAEIAAVLNVQPSLVYNVKAAMANKGKKRRTTAITPTASGNGNGRHNTLDAAIEFVREAGGLDKAEAFLAKLRTIYHL